LCTDDRTTGCTQTQGAPAPTRTNPTYTG
jgi:hypothetical protein